MLGIMWQFLARCASWVIFFALRTAAEAGAVTYRAAVPRVLRQLRCHEPLRAKWAAGAKANRIGNCRFTRGLDNQAFQFVGSNEARTEIFALYASARLAPLFKRPEIPGILTTKEETWPSADENILWEPRVA
jgi:hypothetical protein